MLTTSVVCRRTLVENLQANWMNVQIQPCLFQFHLSEIPNSDLSCRVILDWNSQASNGWDGVEDDPQIIHFNRKPSILGYSIHGNLHVKDPSQSQQSDQSVQSLQSVQSPAIPSDPKCQAQPLNLHLAWCRMCPWPSTSVVEDTRGKRCDKPRILAMILRIAFVG